jgi:Tfp pilus assembly protein PilV
MHIRALISASKIFFNAKPGNYRGDTIVEILITMTIFAVVLSASFASVTHSLQVGTSAGNRDIGTAIGQAQLEVIRSKINSSDPASITPYTSQTSPFCVDSTGNIYTTGYVGANPALADVCAVDNSGNPTTNPNSSFGVSLAYDPSRLVFTALVKWPNTYGDIINESTLYYKVPGGFLVGP